MFTMFANFTMFGRTVPHTKGAPSDFIRLGKYANFNVFYNVNEFYVFSNYILLTNYQPRITDYNISVDIYLLLFMCSH